MSLGLAATIVKPSHRQLVLNARSVTLLQTVFAIGNLQENPRTLIVPKQVVALVHPIQVDLFARATPDTLAMAERALRLAAETCYNVFQLKAVVRLRIQIHLAIVQQDTHYQVQLVLLVDLERISRVRATKLAQVVLQIRSLSQQVSV